MSGAIDYRSFPNLDEVIPEKRQKLGVKYAYIPAADSVAMARDGWRQVQGTHPFEVEDVAYMVMEHGEGTMRSGCYRHQVYVLNDDKITRATEATA